MPTLGFFVPVAVHGQEEHEKNVLAVGRDFFVLVFSLLFSQNIIRYMPPEVAKSLPGNETADVYSFALVIWEMIVLEKPFMYYNIQSLWNE